MSSTHEVQYDYYVGYLRRPSSENNYTENSFLFILHHLKVAQFVHFTREQKLPNLGGGTSISSELEMKLTKIRTGTSKLLRQ